MDSLVVYFSYKFCVQLPKELRLSELQLDLSWRSRDLNEEADDLTNSNFIRFDTERRIQVDASKLEWKILPILDKEAQRLYVFLKKIKEVPTQLPKDKFATEHSERGLKRQKSYLV